MGVLRRCASGPGILSALLVICMGSAVAQNNTADVDMAMQNSSGVMDHDVYISVVNFDAQFVQITNSGAGEVNIGDWKLMNKEDMFYTFPKGFVLKADSSVNVHSLAGVDTSTDLYKSGLRWNRRDDSATLIDASGKVASTYRYPVGPH